VPGTLCWHIGHRDLNEQEDLSRLWLHITIPMRGNSNPIIGTPSNQILLLNAFQAGNNCLNLRAFGNIRVPSFLFVQGSLLYFCRMMILIRVNKIFVK
jgi:hypothetical protein